MKKIVYFMFAILLLNFISLASALDCVHGEINDTYPGECGSYVDVNKDGLCDSSQELTSENILDSKLDLKSENALFTPKYSNYYFIWILIVLVVLYFLTLILSKKQFISTFNHRKIWNVILLISFLGVALSGINLVLRLSYGVSINLPFDLLFWHVEFGIAMAVISIFHVLWHLSYFKLLFKFKRKEDNTSQ